MSLPATTLHELQQKLRAGETTPPEVLRALRDRMERFEPQVGAFLSWDFDQALAEAEKADLSLPLGGLPIAIKDNLNDLGQPCTCGSKILAPYRAPYTATVIERLRAAGAIPFGRTNLDEFAMGSSTENSSFQTTKNPWDFNRIPGGSSGGSAAAVASLEALAALGSDTGGSIRQPAALCGVVGLKPSYGRVSRYGLVAFASSLDQIGPFARSTRDCAMLLQAMAGRDPMDSTSLDRAVPDYASHLREDLRGVRLGVPKEYFIDGMDARVRATVEEALRQCEKLGAELVEISLPHTEYAVSVYYIIATAEASSNLARYDGVRYGHRTTAPHDGLLDHYKKTREEGFGSEVKRRIILGTYVLSSGYYDAYYLRAQKVRTLIREDFRRAFAHVDAIVCPTSPEAAFLAGERTQDPLRMYLADIFTIATNLAGICGLSVPAGFISEGASQLPVGLQFLGDDFAEERLLGIAHAYEQSVSFAQAISPHTPL
jgi:aspartyl-tRNA(Asn)/glutamyl-tRNA(Gln) amidotransferase subunit A